MGKKVNVLIVVLLVLLVLTLGYIGYDKYSSWKQEKDLSLFQQGARYGSQQTAAYLYSQALTCQPLPITDSATNRTVNVIAVECLSVQQG